MFPVGPYRRILSNDGLLRSFSLLGRFLRNKCFENESSSRRVSVGVDRVREWRENQSIGTNQRFWSMPDDMLGLPFDQLANMWALASWFMQISKKNTGGWRPSSAFLAISSSRQFFNEKLLEVARWSRQLVLR